MVDKMEQTMPAISSQSLPPQIPPQSAKPYQVSKILLILFALIAILTIGAIAGAYYFGKLGNKVVNRDRQSSKSSPVQIVSSFQGSDKFGLCDGLANDTLTDDITDIKSLGFGFARPRGDVIAQETLEKNGNFDFSASDSLVKRLQDANVKIFGTLFPKGIPKIPESVNLKDYSNYVKATVNHYEGKITYWEVGIEPFCQNSGTSCYKNFFDLVKTTYQVAKSVDPSLLISPGGAAPIYTPTGGIDPQSSAIFKYFFDNGGANYMDFFNFHYLVGEKDQDIKKYVEYWRQYVPKEKQIWLSETGSRDVGDRYTISSDEDTEASWLKDHIDASIQSGVSKIFWCRAEHSFSDMPKVVEVLQSYAKQYGGSPTGQVVKRQSHQGSMQQGGANQQSGGQQPSGFLKIQQPGSMQPNGFGQQPQGQQSINNKPFVPQQ